MRSDWLVALAFVSALGCGVVAGVFFAFSTFVMPALARLPTAQGVAAMQAINVAALTPPFMAALFGTGAACAILAVLAVLRWSVPGAAWLVVGGRAPAARRARRDDARARARHVAARRVGRGGSLGDTAPSEGSAAAPNCVGRANGWLLALMDAASAAPNG
jgi:hypothetical protein